MSKEMWFLLGAFIGGGIAHLCWVTRVKIFIACNAASLTKEMLALLRSNF